MANKWSLQGKLALVTGGTKGIGRAVVEELLELGARVCIASRTEADVQARVAEWREQGGEVYGVAADLAEESGRHRVLQRVEELGSLDLLVNNAGHNIRKPAVEYTDAEVRSVLELDLTSVFELSRAAHPLLRESGASSIVNVVSVSGLTSTGTGTPYAMAKAGVIQMTENLAVEWADDGIRVNAVAPWYTRTPLVEKLLDDPAYLSAIEERTPLGRIAEPEEVAAAVVFFALPAASYITGQCLSVDGGLLANGFLFRRG